MPCECRPRDADSVERASEGLRRKYSDSAGRCESMLEDDILETTVRLERR